MYSTVDVTVVYIQTMQFYLSTFVIIKARCTKQGKLAWDHNPIKAQMGVEILWMTKRKLKSIKTQPDHINNDQRNLPRAAQISIRVANKQWQK